MRWRVGVGIAGILALAGVAWHLFSPQAPSASTAVAASASTSEVSVNAGPVRIGAVRRQIEAVGSLRSDESVILRPEVAGRISEILFKEGQKVSQGTPLVRLDSSIAQAQVAQMQAALGLSKVNFERAQELVKRGAGSQRAYDEALARMRADEASLALAQATLDKMTLVAPFDGTLGLRRVSLGDYVNPGQDIVNIESIDTLKVDFRVSEIYAVKLKVGQAINVTLDAIPGARFEGEVYAIDPAHDPNGRAAILRARMANKDGQLRPGMFARVVLILDAGQESILVPETAIVPMGQEQMVFVLDGDKARLTKLKTGQRRGGMVEVIEGLERTSLIVTEGAMKLRDGMMVKANLEKAD
jgi:membrane fusion protein (multidrug efflux system)